MPSQQLLPPQPTTNVEPDPEGLRPAGWLLVAGALVSLAAGATPSMFDLYTSQTPGTSSNSSPTAAPPGSASTWPSWPGWCSSPWA
jgi:hypothetical protein